MENIRDIIEDLVEQLVGNVDDTSVDRLYNNPLYDQIFDDYRIKLVNELKHLTSTLELYKPATNSMAHTALRELVERAVDEARKLPGLGDSVSEKTRQESSVSQQTYEDLLATAILNKVIEKCQKDQVDGNSNIVHRKTSRKCKYVRHNNEDMDEDSTDLEPMSHEDCSSECSGKIQRSCIHSDPLSLTIEEQIEEITTVYSSDEDCRCLKADLNFPSSRRVPFPEFGMDIIDPSQESSKESQDEIETPGLTDHVTPMESWEENWLFQKKKIAIQSDPVSMLVPNPSADYRALIGDKDAEDTSDLSECSVNSDEEVEIELQEVFDQVLPKSETKDISVDQQENQENYVDLNDELNIETSIEESKADEIFDLEVPKIILNGSDEFIANERRENSQVISEGDQMVESKDGSVENVCDDVHKEENVDGRIDEPKTPAPTPVRDSLDKNDDLFDQSCNLNEVNTKLEVINNEEFSNEIITNFLDNERKMYDDISEVILNDAATLEEDESHCGEKLESRVQSELESTENKNDVEDDNLELSAPPRPGTIAEREHKKWENAVPIENNPYTEEGLQKRNNERQYSRRLSDVNGDLTASLNSPCSPVQIVLNSNRPDMTRFKRDYYINESNDKSPLENSASSRPSSSLSSTGSDFERQVSYGVNKFEEISLRSNLQRRVYCGSNTTTHFAINPLLSFDKSQVENTEVDLDNNLNSLASFQSNSSLDIFESNSESQFTMNPIFCDGDKSLELSSKDRDSGMYSIDSNDDNLMKLSWDENVSKDDNRKCLIFNSQKFHTFGGIKRRKVERSSSEESFDSDENLPDVSTDFSKFKFQTFGGIKNNSKKVSKVRSSIKSIAKSPVKMKDQTVEHKMTIDSILRLRCLNGDSLKLEPPAIPQVVDKKFTSLVDLRRT